MNLDPIDKDQKGNYYKVLDSFYVYGGDLSDKYVQASCRTLRYWDDELTNFMIQNIKPGWKCLDIGSNIGYFSEVMARLAGPTGEVVAFEPIKRLVDAYEEGRSLNDYSNSAPITVHNFGLSNENKSGYVRILEHNVGGSHVTDDAGEGSYEKWGAYTAQKTELKVLSDIYDKTPDFIKIDIEGYERFAFEGFGENVLKCPLIVIELGEAHPIPFYNYLTRNYNMTYVGGTPAYSYDIIGHDVINIVLRKK